MDKPLPLKKDSQPLDARLPRVSAAISMASLLALAALSSLRPVIAHEFAVPVCVTLACGTVSVLFGLRRLRHLTGRLVDATVRVRTLQEELALATTELELVETLLSESFGSEQPGIAAVEKSLSELAELSECVRAAAERELENSVRLAGSGGQSADEAVEQFKSVVVRTSVARRELANMNQIMAQIAERTRLVDDIVFKTSILSFNANIEAARAGTAGRGFSVVADEIGKLSRQTQEASREITSLLDDSQQKVEGIVISSAAAGLSVEKVAGRFTQAYRSLVEGLAEVAPANQRLIASACEQRAACQQANGGMRTIRRSVENGAVAPSRLREIQLRLREALKRTGADLDDAA